MAVLADDLPVGIGEGVGQTAELGAVASVGAAAGAGLAHVALTAITYAERAVYKSLQLYIGVFPYATNLFEGKFAGEDGALQSHLFPKQNFLQRAVVGLRAGM